jgi:hypothetical protein
MTLVIAVVPVTAPTMPIVRVKRMDIAVPVRIIAIL